MGTNTSYDKTTVKPLETSSKESGGQLSSPSLVATILQLVFSNLSILELNSPHFTLALNTLLQNINAESSDAELLEQALAEGIDLTTLLEATAAGPAAGAGAANEGIGATVVLDPGLAAQIVEAGYDTTFEIAPPEPPIEQAQLLPEEVEAPPPPPPDTPPTVDPENDNASAIVDEGEITDSENDSITFIAGTQDVTGFAFSSDISGMTIESNNVAGIDIVWTRVSDTVITGKLDENGDGIGDGLIALTITLVHPAVIPAGATDDVTVLFELSDNFFHEAGLGTNNFIVTGLGVVVTDAIGATAEGSVNVTVIDDVPTAIGEGIQSSVQEDGMSLITGDLSEGNKEGGETNTDDEASGGVGSLLALFDSGADDPLTISLLSDISGLPALLSKGDLVTYSVNPAGDTLTAMAGGRTVFVFTVNPDGSWAFDLNDQLDHFEDGLNTENYAMQLSGGGSVPTIDLSSIIQATDADGDTVIAALNTMTIDVQDDIPEAHVEVQSVTGFVEEDGMSIGTLDLSEGNKEVGDTNADDEDGSAAGSLTSLFSSGADEPLLISLDSDVSGLPALLSKGDLVTYSVNPAGDTLTAEAGGRTVFILVVNPDGSWNFDLQDQLDHVDDGANDENYALQLSGGGSINAIDFSSILKATDFDGDEVVGAAEEGFSIQIQDDIPVAVDDVDNIAVNGSVEEDGMSLATGDLSEGNKEGGDTNTDDETSGVAGSLSALFSSGADEDLSLSIDPDTSDLPALLSKGDLVTYSVNPAGDTLTAEAGGRTVFILVVNPDGSWNFDLQDQLDHVDDGGNDENFALQLNGGGSVNAVDFSSILKATDFDGDEVVGAAEEGFSIQIQDDIPVAVDDVDNIAVSGSVEEDGMSLATGDLSEGNKEGGDTNADDETSGVAGSLSALFSSGADEDLSLSIDPDTSDLPALLSKGDLVTYSVNPAGDTLTAEAGGRTVFILVVNPDGSWNFDLQDQLDHVDDGANDENFALQLNGGGSINAIDFSSILKATDFDGDEVVGAAEEGFSIQIQDDIPVAVDDVDNIAVSGSVEEDGMSLATGDLSEGNKEGGDTNADDETSGVAGSLTPLFSSGADEDLSLSIDPDTSDLPALLSKGDLVTYSVNPAGDTLTAEAGGRTVFILVVNPDGSWNFDLQDQLDHVDDGANDENYALQLSGGGSINAIDFSSILKATDFDGDEVVGAADEAFTLQIQDDIPVAVDDVDNIAVSGSVEEDGMSLATGDLSEGNKEGGDTNADDETSGVAGSLTPLFSSGADEDLSLSIDPDTSDLPALLSKGDLVTYSVNPAGDTLTAEAGGRTVFILVVNPDGSWNFDLQDQLDHVDDGANDENYALQLSGGGSINAIDFSSILKATDFDGDEVVGAADEGFSIQIQDDIPVAVDDVDNIAVNGSVEEDGMSLATGDLSEGNKEGGDTNTDDETSGVAGSLSALFSSGADEDLSLSIDPDTSDLPALLSKGDLVTYSVNPAGDTLTAEAGGRTVFILVVNPDGSWNFDLQDQLDHVDDGGNDENFALQLNGGGSVNAVDFSSILKATDFDGDEVVGAAEEGFSIQIQDDIPVAVDDVDNIAVNGSVEEDGMSLATGDLSEGNKEGGDTNADDETSGVAGSLSSLFSSGADEDLSLSIYPDTSDLPALLSKGDLVTYSVNPVGDTLTAEAGGRTVFILVVNPDGSWNFDLQDQLDHVDDGGNDENFALQLNGGGSVNAVDFSSILKATDFDGDEVVGAAEEGFSIQIQDDIPVAVDDVDNIAVSGSVEEDGMSLATGDLSEGNKEGGDTNADDETSGVAGSLSALFSSGADEDLSLSIDPDTSDLPALLSKGDLVTYSVNPAGDTLTAEAGGRTVFILVVNPDGSWNFDLQDQLDHVDDGANDENFALQLNGGGSINAIDFSSILKATDFDGDEVVGAAEEGFSIQIQDDIPVAVDDVDNIAVNGSVEEDGMSLATGDLSEGNKEGGDTNADDETSGVAGSLSSLFSSGADEDLSLSIYPDTSDLPALLSKGDLVTYSVNPAGDTLTAEAGGRTVFILVVNPDGSWNFDLQDQLDHVDDGGNDENFALQLNGGGSVNAVDFSSILKATDFDGDEVVGAAEEGFSIQIQDDIPVAVDDVDNIAVSGSVEEDGMSLATGDLSEGNKEGGDTNADDETSGVAGSLSALFSSGADEDLSLSIDPDTSDLPALLSKGDLVTYSVNPAGDTLTAEAGGRTVFILVVNPDGSWNFDLQDQLDHVDDGANDENFALQLNGGGSINAIDFSSILKATDFDGDEVVGAAEEGFSIQIQDDIPVAVDDVDNIAVSGSVEEDGMSLATGDLSEGNKEGGDTNADDETSGVAGSLSSLFSSGADEDLSLSIDPDTSDLPALLSKGDLVTYSVNPAGDTLTAEAGGRTVFILNVNADGSWNFDLQDQLDHVDDGANDENFALQLNGGGSVNAVDFSSVLKATDFDGDEVVGAAEEGFSIQIQDDIPVAVDDVDNIAVNGSVEEDGMSLATGDLSEGNKEGGDTNADDETSGVAGSLSALFSSGADEDLSLSIDPDTSDLPALLSKGDLVTYSVNPAGDTLTAEAGGRTVFILVVNPDGSWNFDLQDQLDHVDDGANDENFALQLSGGGSVNAVDFSSVLKATDFDGDEVVGAAEEGFSIQIQDDIPVAVDDVDNIAVSGSVEEDGMSLATGDLSEGNKEGGDTNADDETSGVAGSLSALFSSGADEDLSLSIDPDTSDLPALLSKGDLVTYSVNPAGDTLTAEAGGRTVFILVVNPDGSWNFDLQDQLDHVDDGANDENFALQLSGGGSVNAVDFSSILKATDFDGDEVVGAAEEGFSIQVQDDIPTVNENAQAIQAQVEEDDLNNAQSVGNNEDGSVNAHIAQGIDGTVDDLQTLFNVGADEELTIMLAPANEAQATAIVNSLALISKGDVLNGATILGNKVTATADGREIFSLEINADGSWEFTLIDQLDHAPIQGENFLSANGIDLSAFVKAVDFDGDEVSLADSGKFFVQVQDDIPIAVNDVDNIAVSGSVEEDGMSLATGDLSEGNKEGGDTNADDETSGVAGSLSALFSSGADEDLSLSIDPDTSDLPALLSKGDLVTYSVNPAGDTLTAEAGGRTVFILVVNPDGSWNFDLQDQLDHVDDGANDENFALQLSGGGSINAIDFSSVLKATDFDDDEVVGAASEAFTIQVQDDIPVAVDDVDNVAVSAQVEEDGMSLATGDLSEGNKEVGDTNADDETSGLAGSLTPLFSSGADEELSLGIDPDTSGLPDLLSKGDAVSYSVNPAGDTLTAEAGGRTVFILNVNEDGSWNFDLQDQLDHVDDGANDENYALQLNGGGSINAIDFSSVLKATDYDGDEVVGAAEEGFTIQVQDDIPVAQDDAACVDTLQSNNVVLVIDRSGSMAADSGINNPNAVGDYTRLEALQLALEELLEAYENIGPLNVHIVSFAGSNSQTDHGWVSEGGGMSAAENAMAIINGLSAGGTTDYDDALQTVINGYAPPSVADATTAYFLSDGEPNTDTFKQQALDFQDEWETFLTNEGFDNAYGVGMGADISDLQYLDVTSYPNDDVNPADGQEDNTLLVTDFSQLVNVLLNSVNYTAAGNVLTNDSIGADEPGQLKSINFNGQDYLYDGVDPSVMIVTPEGELTFYFADMGAHVAGDFVFATNDVSADADIYFDYVYEDFDGDESEATLHICIEADLKPIITIEKGEVDEAALPTGTNAGSNAEHTSGVFNIVLGDDVLTDHTVTIKDANDIVVDLTGLITGAPPILVTGANGDLTVSFNNGTQQFEWDYTLNQNVFHTQPADDDILLGESFKVVVTDLDGDFDSDNLEICIKDDVPFAISPDAAVLTNDGSSSLLGIKLDVDTNIDNNVGADQVGSIAFANITDGDDSGLTSGGIPILLYLSPDSQILTGSTAASEGDVDGSNTVFIITLNPDGSLAASNDNYDVELFDVIDNGSGVTFSDLTGTGPAGNTTFKIIESSGDVEILLTTSATTSDLNLNGTINSDSDDIGLNNQWIDPNNNSDEVLRIDFGDFDIVGTTFDINQHSTVNGVRFEIHETGANAANEVDVKVQVFDADDDNNLTEDGADTITRVVIFDDDGTTVLADATGSGNVGGFGFTFDGSNGVTITDMIEGYYIQTFTADGYNRLEIDNVTSPAQANDTFSVGGLSVATVDTGESVNLIYDLELTDSDGDTVVIDDAIDVTLNPEVAPLVNNFFGGNNFMRSDNGGTPATLTNLNAAIPLLLSAEDAEVANLTDYREEASLGLSTNAAGVSFVNLAFKQDNQLFDNEGDAIKSGGRAIYLFGFGTDELIGTTDNLNQDNQSAWIFDVSLDLESNEYMINMNAEFDTADNEYIEFSLNIEATDSDANLVDGEIHLSLLGELSGDDDANTLTGTFKSELIRGFGGDDVIDGGAGNDLINAGSGNNNLIGGEGGDTFEFSWDDLLDSNTVYTIEDFDITQDTLSFVDVFLGSGDIQVDVSDLDSHVQELAPSGNDFAITMNSGAQIILVGQAATLNGVSSLEDLVLAQVNVDVS